jgi:hypothetical protein
VLQALEAHPRVSRLKLVQSGVLPKYKNLNKARGKRWFDYCFDRKYILRCLAIIEMQRSRGFAYSVQANTNTHTNAPTYNMVHSVLSLITWLYVQEALSKAFKPKYGLESLAICVPW